MGRPYHLTFEILDRSEVKDGRELRIVPAAELHAAELVEQAETDGLSTPQIEVQDLTVQQPISKSNVDIHDDPTNQKLTMAEIESLKLNTTGSGRELVERILQSHSTLDQKTAFSLAKYTLRKHKKYMKRFTVLPLDVSTLVDCMFADREYGKIMEMRNEALGLVGCWADVHAAGENEALLGDMDLSSRYLVVDDTGGLVLAAMAERMGILHTTNFEAEATASADEDVNGAEEDSVSKPDQRSHRKRFPSAMSASSDTITLVHANQQPNLGLLRHFNYDSNNPTPSHPLYTHLKTISWLQLLEPSSDITYQEPSLIADSELQNMKSNRRSTYYRKRRRWERVKSVVDEANAGEFNGLVIASFTDPISIVRHLLPLLAGGSQVVVYSPTIEPLVDLADCYSTARRAAFINTPLEERTTPTKDFPVDPTLLLAPMVQTARVRRWQVLPGRTHPLMTGRGGAEGYIFVGTRVIPAEGKVEARGRPPRGKKAKVGENDDPDAQNIPRKHSIEDGIQEQNKKQKVEDDNEPMAQTAVDQKSLEQTGQEDVEFVVEAPGAVDYVQILEQELEGHEMPVLGPATEALKEKYEEVDVRTSVES